MLFFNLLSAFSCLFKYWRSTKPKFYSPIDYTDLKSNNNFSRSDSLLLVLKENYNKAVAANKELVSAGYLNKMGELLFASGHYPQALDYLLRADKIYRNNPDKKQLAENLVLLGELYYRSRQPTQARKQYNEALNNYQQLKLTSGIALVYGHIGYLYEKKQLYDSAFYFQNKALLVYKTPQAYIVGYKNTIVNAGWRRPTTKGGSIWLEKAVRVDLYNNLLANDRYGIKKGCR